MNTDARRIPPPYPSLDAFLQGMRRGDAHALNAYFAFYAPLLLYQARRLGLDPGEGSQIVTTVLGDVAFYLSTGRPFPREFHRFLVTCLRNAVRKSERTKSRHALRLGEAHTTVNNERVVAASHSEYALHASGAATAQEAERLSHAIALLSQFTQHALNETDRAIAVATSHHIPLREIAPSLGLTPTAARVRLHRLRERLAKLAYQYADTLELRERLEVQRFLKRAGIPHPSDDE